MKTILFAAQRGAAVLLATLIFSGCSSGSSDDDTPASVVAMDVEDSTLRVGDSTSLSIEFTFAQEQVDDDDRNVIIAVHLPNGFRYENESAEVEKIGEDDDVDPLSDTCGDGSQLLLFDLDEQDLRNAENPDDDAEARLDLTIMAISAVGSTNIDARAAYDNLNVSCGSRFLPEDSVVVVSL